jgi:uncharacterized protein HemY
MTALSDFTIKTLRFLSESKRWVLLVLWLFATCYNQETLAQEKAVNELHKKLNALVLNGTQESDSAYVNTLNQLALAYGNFNPNSSLVIAKKALKNAEIGNYMEGKAEALRHLGYAYHLNNAKTEAVQNLNLSIKLAQELHNKNLLSKSYNTLAIVFKSHSLFSDALEYYLKSLQLKIELNDIKGQANSYGNIGNLFRNLEGYPKAVYYQEKSLSLFRKLNDSLGISNGLGNLGLTYVDLRDWFEAEKYVRASIVWKKKLGDLRGLSYDLTNLGVILDKTNRKDSALYYHEKALSLKLTLGEQVPIGISYLGLSRLYFHKGDLNKALLLANKAFDYLSSSRHFVFMSEVHQQLASIYSTKKQFKEAYFHQSEANIFNDSIKLEVLGKKMMLMEIQLQEAINKEKNKAKTEFLEAKFSKQRYWIFAFAGVIFLLIVTSFFLFRDRIKLKQSHLKLKRAHDEITRQHREIELKSAELERYNAALIEQQKEVNFLNNHLQMKIAEGTETLEKRNASLRNYAFSLSHLLRKHAANILGLSELLSQTNPNTEEFSQMVHHLNASAINLDDTIREMNHQLQSGHLDHLNPIKPTNDGG